MRGHELKVLYRGYRGVSLIYIKILSIMKHEHHSARHRAVKCALEIAKLAFIGATAVATIHLAQDVHKAKRRFERFHH